MKDLSCSPLKWYVPNYVMFMFTSRIYKYRWDATERVILSVFTPVISHIQQPNNLEFLSNIHFYPIIGYYNTLSSNDVSFMF